MTRLESYAAEPVVAVAIVDRFAQQRGDRGPVPAPLPPLRFTLVARDGQPLDPPVELFARGGGPGVFLFADESRIGRSALLRIEPGSYTLRVESDLYLPLEVDLEWPSADALHLALNPAASYPFPSVTLASAKLTLLRGTLRDPDDHPVAGASVAIIDPPDLGDFAVSASDALGGWTLAFQSGPGAPIAATVRITRGVNSIDIPNVVIVPGSENSLPVVIVPSS